MKISAPIGVAALALGALLASCNNSGSSAFGAPTGANLQLTVRAAHHQDSATAPQVQNQNGPTEIWNVTESAPNQTATDFEVTFAGDVTNDLTSTALPQPYNPFCPPSNSYGCPLGVTYNSGNDTTTVEFSGTLAENIPPSDPCYPCYHFGLFGLYNIQYQGVGGYKPAVAWTYPRKIRPTPWPWHFVAINPPSAGVKKQMPWAYAELYIAVSLNPSGGLVSELWQEVGYVPKGSAQPKFTFDNYGKKKLYVRSSGVILNQPVPTDPACQQLSPPCPEDFDILATLNFAGSPPPGFSGSRFEPLKYPPPHVLKPKKM